MSETLDYANVGFPGSEWPVQQHPEAGVRSPPRRDCPAVPDELQEGGEHRAGVHHTHGPAGEDRPADAGKEKLVQQDVGGGAAEDHH